MVTATSSIASWATERCRAALNSGISLPTASKDLAAQMEEEQILQIWREKGGFFLYELAYGQVRQTRRGAGMPGGYQETAEGYKQDRIDEVMSCFIGVLKDSRLQLMAIGIMESEDWLGAAENHHALAEGNRREERKCEDIAHALEPGQATRDLDPETFARIWWGE